MAKISDILEERILSGVYKANERLPSITQLAGEFGVSYGTVHTAFSKLASKKLVLIEQGRGTLVIGDKPLSLEWLMFGRAASLLVGGPIDKALSFLRSYWGDYGGSKVLLNFNLLDVRNLPEPEMVAESCRLRCARGLLVSGHGTEYAPYVDRMSRHIPTVSMFGHWDAFNLHCVAPDFGKALAEQLALWRTMGADKIGLCSMPEGTHPNYDEFNRQAVLQAAEAGVELRPEDRFLGRSEDALPWIAGKIALGNCPRFWLTLSSGYARGVEKAAELHKMRPGRGIHIMSTDMDEPKLHGFSVAMQQVDVTVKKGIETLERLVWPDSGDLADLPKKLLVPLRLVPPNTTK